MSQVLLLSYHRLAYGRRKFAVVALLFVNSAKKENQITRGIIKPQMLIE